uniref:4Fe-4S ferredoxin-type domain-containing protein n=1 Tax=Macrostomum lignano TaxID=282301 RepID=A0A1I8F7D9_9PLAT
MATGNAAPGVPQQAYCSRACQQAALASAQAAVRVSWLLKLSWADFMQRLVSEGCRLAPTDGHCPTRPCASWMPDHVLAPFQTYACWAMAAVLGSFQLCRLECPMGEKCRLAPDCPEFRVHVLPRGSETLPELALSTNRPGCPRFASSAGLSRPACPSCWNGRRLCCEIRPVYWA